MDYNTNFPLNNLSNLNIIRYPITDKTNVQAWNSADNFLITFALNNKPNNKAISIYNDSYGFINLNLKHNTTYFITDLKSQINALEFNANRCSIKTEIDNTFNPFENLPKKVDLSLIKIPKSLDLFELYLKHIYNNLNDNGTVACGFMTKFFTKQYLEIAKKYFTNVTQTKAWKKSRLIILQGKKEINASVKLTKKINSEWGNFAQYFGVFSASHIDYATQYLIRNINIPKNAATVLDLASGNGILTKVLHQINSNLNIHLVDDSFLAIQSSKLNVKKDKSFFHQTYNLNNFEANFFDYVITNPPFHVGFEINVNLPLTMFEDVYRVLKPGGEFQLVSNNHLNYKLHLIKMFSEVQITASNPKYTVYTCVK